MKVNLLSLLCVLLLAQLSSAKRDPSPACHGSFKRRPEICSQFNFITNPEAVQGSCMETKNGTTFYDLSELPEITQVDPQAVKMASLITNVFEESSTSFAYAQCSDIGDSRGYTSGYVGFTTGTGDAEILIDQYAKIKPGNALSKYLDRLHEISQLPTCDRPNRGKTGGLEGYIEAWKQEACSPDQSFAHLQRQWVYENYMIPSNRYAAQNGVNSALGRAIFYDTIIQHGFQYTEPDINIVRLLTLTGGRKENETEQAFLTRFLTVRRQLQCCYPDNVWPASATRSEDLQNLVDNFDYNKDLIHQIRLKNFQVNITGKEDLDLIDSRCFQK